MKLDINFSMEALTCLPIIVCERVDTSVLEPMLAWDVVGSGWDQFMRVVLLHPWTPLGWFRARAEVEADWRHNPDMDEVIVQITLWGTKDEGDEEEQLTPDWLSEFVLVRDCTGAEPGPWTLLEEWNEMHPEDQL